MQGRAVQSSHMPKQYRTAGVTQKPLSSCVHHASQADQHCLVKSQGAGQINRMSPASCMLLALI